MTARGLCMVVLALEAAGLSISISSRKWMVLIFYTQISNMMAAVSALSLAVFGQPEWVTIQRYLSTCMLVMTFLVTTCVLIPMGGNPKQLLWSGNGIYHHVLCPIISTMSYCLVEKHCGFDMVWLPVLVTLIYGLIMLWLNAVRKADGPYPFFRVHNQSVRATVIWVLVLLLVIGLISIAVCFVAG